MLSPKRVKFRKQHRGRRAGFSRGQQKVEFGEYGLKALETGWLTNRQIEAARIAMTRKIKRGGKVWINVYPDKPFTKKPAETRMGSGKGNPEGWVAVVKPGRVMFELAGVDEQLAREAMRLAGHKLPLKTKFVTARGRVHRMKARELRDLSDDALRDQIANVRRDLFGLRMQHATGELENTAGLSGRKRDLARALTVAHQRGIDSNVTVTLDTEETEVMADEDKTPETEETPDSIQEEVETAASEEGAGDTSTVDTPKRPRGDSGGGGPCARRRGAPEAAAEPQEVLAPKERRARRRAAKAPPPSGPKTAEERNAERLAARAHKAKLRRNYRERAKTKEAERKQGRADAASPTPRPSTAPAAPRSARASSSPTRPTRRSSCAST